MPAKYARGNAQPVKPLQDRPPSKGASETASFKTSGRSDDRTRQVNHASAFLESSRKIQVLEKRNGFEPANFLVSGGADENAGVAVAESYLSQSGIEPSHKAGASFVTVKANGEVTSKCRGITREGLGDALSRVRWWNRIGVQ